MGLTRRLLKPGRWTPPRAPADRGRTGTTSRLVVARRVMTGGHGPEDVNALLDRLLPLPGFWRTLVWNLPDAVRPKPTRIGWVMAFDLDGRLVHDLRTDDGSYAFVTSVTEHNGTVVVGSLHEDDVAVLARGE